MARDTGNGGFLMEKYRKRPVVIEAEVWNKLNDVPEASISKNSHFNNELLCSYCNHKLGDHGRVRTLEGFHIVCPGDYIIKGIKNEFYPCKPDVFEMTYEKVD